jgi:hypothetical protein
MRHDSPEFTEQSMGTIDGVGRSRGVGRRDYSDAGERCQRSMALRDARQFAAKIGTRPMTGPVGQPKRYQAEALRV